MRDPLKQEMEMIFRKSRLDNLLHDEKSKLNNLFEELWIKTRDKWNCFLNPTWYDKKESDIAEGKVDFVCYLSKDELSDLNAIEKIPACFVFSSGKSTVIDYERHIVSLLKNIKGKIENPYTEESKEFNRQGWIFHYLNGGYDDRGNVYIPVSPGCIPIGIDIGGLSEKDQTRVTEEIWTLIKSKIKERKAKGQKHLPAIRDSKELGFITSKKIEDKDFKKYLKWYDLHIEKGLHFRTIAFHEYLEREQPDKAEESKRRIAERTKTIKTRNGKERTIKGFIGPSIKGEDNVEKAVKLIYQAIHRKVYASKKKQSLYNCPEHGRECPINCSYYEQYMKDFNKRKTLFKPLVTTAQELPGIDFEKEFQKTEERIDKFFKNKKRIK